MYTVNRIENTVIVSTRHFARKRDAREYWMKLFYDTQTCYPRLVVDGEPMTIGKALKIFRIGRANRKDVIV